MINNFSNESSLRADMELLKACRRNYERLADLRSRRKLCKDFAYGRQWGERVRLHDGRVLSEEDRLREEGRVPLTNNLIRQLLKSVVGRYRYLLRRRRSDSSEPLADSVAPDALMAEETDARALEEFLISGCAFQRLGSDGSVANVSPDRVFFSPFGRSDAADCRLMGMLHDMPLSEAVARFTSGAPKQTERLLGALVCRGDDMVGAPNPDLDADVVQVMEVWRRRTATVAHVHDRKTGAVATMVARRGMNRAVNDVNRGRRARGEATSAVRYSVAEVTEHVWLSPGGKVLAREEFPGRRPFGIVGVCYPMIDGEVHSLVEDVMPQQRYVNRLVTLMDEIMDFSAKGVLLFPTDQLPNGLKWQELRRLWARPGAIIPFKRTSRTVTPQQVNAGGSLAGAVDMLKTQLQMFDDITGTTRASRGGVSEANSADMMRRETENAIISMLDILSCFEAFTARRDTVREAAKAESANQKTMKPTDEKYKPNREK